MSWSVSAAAPRDEAVRQIREQFERAKSSGLPSGEAARAEKVLEAVQAAADLSEPTDVLRISAWGSESYAWEGGVATKLLEAQANYSVVIERPVPTEPTAAA